MSFSLNQGQTKQLSTVVKNAEGTVLIGQPITWSSDNQAVATIDGNGLVTGGASLGNANIIAAIGSLQSLPDVCTGLGPVLSPPPPPPSPDINPGQLSIPNQPAGLVQARYQSFDTAENADFFDASTNPHTLYSTIVDATNPGTSPNVGQMKFPAGFPSGIAPARLAMRTDFVKTKVYQAFWIKFSTNWYAPDTSGANKIGYHNFGSFEMLGFGGTTPPGVNGVQLLIPQAILENIVGISSGSGSSGPGPSIALAVTNVPYDYTQIQYVRGNWGLYEIYMEMNTPGNYDGTYKWWFNNILYGDYTNRIRYADSGGLSGYRWEPTYGGSGSPVPSDQYMWLKDFYIATN